MGEASRVLQLVERVYRAALAPDAWEPFLKELSEALGGAAIQLSVRMPQATPSEARPVHRIHLDESYAHFFEEYVLEGLRGVDWSHAARGFARADELVISDVGLDQDGFRRDFKAPQGLTDDPPLCHLISTEFGRPLAGMVIYRREGCRPFGADDLELLDALAPHLTRAYAIQCRIASAEHETNALSEVMDRMPSGVLLLDGEGRRVFSNRGAELIIAQDDGLRMENERPRLSKPREERTLQALIAAAVQCGAKKGAGGAMSVTRPSGRRSYALMVGPLLAPPPGTGLREAVAILFVSDPQGGAFAGTEVLQSLYELTQAEAELVRLISEGRSLEEVARIRGVTMNTIRTQLKHVFSKTDTNRQGELVHLVLTGVAWFGEERLGN